MKTVSRWNTPRREPQKRENAPVDRFGEYIKAREAAVIEECAKVITDELARMPPDHELTKIGSTRKGMCELLLRDIRALSRPVSEREGE